MTKSFPEDTYFRAPSTCSLFCWSFIYGMQGKGIFINAPTTSVSPKRMIQNIRMDTMNLIKFHDEFTSARKCPFIVVVVVVFSTSLSLNFRHFTWVRHNSQKNSATNSCQYVQYFRVSKQWYSCHYSGLFTCTQSLMHAIALGGCMYTNTVRMH